MAGCFDIEFLPYVEKIEPVRYDRTGAAEEPLAADCGHHVTHMATLRRGVPPIFCCAHGHAVVRGEIVRRQDALRRKT